MSTVMQPLNQVEIQQTQTDIVVTDGVGSLSREDVQKLVSIVLQHIRHEQDMCAQKRQDTAISNRVFPPPVQ